MLTRNLYLKAATFLKFMICINNKNLSFTINLFTNYYQIFLMNFKLVRHSDQHDHNTRHNNSFITPRLKYNASKSSILKRLPGIINEAPQHVLDKVMTHSLHGFSFYYKRIKIDEYRTFCTIFNCYICQN